MLCILQKTPKAEIASAIKKAQSNKETSRWDEAKDWEGVCIPSPIRAQ